MFVVHIHVSRYLQRQFIPRIGVVSQRHGSSLLYITGDRASKTVSVLTPHLDFSDRFQDIPSLEKNVALRGMKLNVVKLSEQWGLLQDVVTNKTLLENRRIEIAETMKELKKVGNLNDIERFKIQGKLVRDDLKTLMKTLWSLEENVVIKALTLPNDLHPHTPSEEGKVVYQFGDNRLSSCPLNHVEIGKRASVLDFSSPAHYYLKGNAALYELCALHYFAEKLRNCQFLQFSNADFARSVVIEGTGMEHYNPNAVFALKDMTDSSCDHNRQHLVGGASLISFCAFHAKHVIQSDVLPLKYFTMGCQYNPTCFKIQQRGLFDVWQSTAVEVFIGTYDYFNDMMVEFNQTLETLIWLYKQLGYHFRIVYLPPKELKPWESLRASVQMYSPHFQSYIEVGHLSTCDTYISKRLLMYYESENTNECKFVRIVSGTALSVPKLLGCVLEFEQNSLTVPSQIRNHSFSDINGFCNQ